MPQDETGDDLTVLRCHHCANDIRRQWCRSLSKYRQHLLGQRSELPLYASRRESSEVNPMTEPTEAEVEAFAKEFKMFRPSQETMSRIRRALTAAAQVRERAAGQLPCHTTSYSGRVYPLPIDLDREPDSGPDVPGKRKGE